MQFSLPFIDILIFAIIAVFLIFRLKNILGAKTGFDPAENNEKNVKKQKDFSNVINFTKEHETTSKIQIKINELKKMDNSFSIDEFVSGANIFFDMIINGFVNGDLTDVKQYVKPKLYNNFKNAIEERIKDNEELIINVKKINNTVIKEIKILKVNVKITVLFESLQIKALKDENGKIIDGNINEEILVKDLWTFEKDLNSNDKNWVLVETNSN